MYPHTFGATAKRPEMYVPPGGEGGWGWDKRLEIDSKLALVTSLQNGVSHVRKGHVVQGIS